MNLNMQGLKDNMVLLEEDEFKIRNRMTKKDKEAEKMEDE